MMDKSTIDAFNKAVKGSYKFKKITDSLYFSQIAKSDLGAFGMVVSDAGIYLYEYPGHSGAYFEVVFKLTGGHFSTAMIGKVEDNKFSKFNLKDFAEEISVFPGDLEDRINDKITKAIV